MKYITLDEALRLADKDDVWRQFQVDYPEDSQGPFSIERYEIPRLDKGRINTIRREGLARDPGHGKFTRLVEAVSGAGEEGGEKRRVWMSDTKAEILEHSPFFNRLPVIGVWNTHPLRILVNGLGLALVVNGAIKVANIKHIDVVEVNSDVAELVYRHVPEDKVTLHLGDAYSIAWPRGTRWDMAWHDIWPQIDDENIPQMNELIRKYRGRVRWQGCWQREGCLKMAKYLRQAKEGTLDPNIAYQILSGKFPL